MCDEYFSGYQEKNVIFIIMVQYPLIYYNKNDDYI